MARVRMARSGTASLHASARLQRLSRPGANITNLIGRYTTATRRARVHQAHSKRGARIMISVTMARQSRAIRVAHLKARTQMFTERIQLLRVCSTTFSRSQRLLRNKISNGDPHAFSDVSLGTWPA